MKTIYLANHSNRTCIKQRFQADFPEFQVPPGAYYIGTGNIRGIETDDWKYGDRNYVIFSFVKNTTRLLNIFSLGSCKQLIPLFRINKGHITEDHAFQNFFVESIIPKRPDDREFNLPPYCKI